MALQSKKIVFVFTPTVALMYEQVQQMKSKGIPAIALGDEGKSLDDLIEQPSAPLLVYLTAEYLYGPGGECSKRVAMFESLVHNGRVSLIAIDEVHLLFEWEHFRYNYYQIVFIVCIIMSHAFDFCRPSFKMLQNIRNRSPTIPITCPTATATPQHVEKLRNMFHLPSIHRLK